MKWVELMNLKASSFAALHKCFDKAQTGDFYGLDLMVEINAAKAVYDAAQEELMDMEPQEYPEKDFDTIKEVIWTLQHAPNLNGTVQRHIDLAIQLLQSIPNPNDGEDETPDAFLPQGGEG